MALKNLFRTVVGPQPTEGLTQNEAGGTAYALDDRSALAQYAATGCLAQTFYASAEDQLEMAELLADGLEDSFLAKTAIYARKKGFMKDMPALLCAILAARNSELLETVFPVVIDNGKMLRNFVQIIRSGRIGRKSFGSRVRRLIRNWLASRTDEQLFTASVGNTPSLADIIKMVHPHPETPQREALFAYLIGREYNAENLPEIVRQYIAFREQEEKQVKEDEKFEKKDGHLYFHLNIQVEEKQDGK